MWQPLYSYFTSHRDVEKAGKVRTISTILNDPLSKVWLLFLSNVLPVYDKFNKFFQTSSASTIHKLFGECERLFKTVLSFFICSQTIKENATDLMKLDYTDASISIAQTKIYLWETILLL